jgi:hypothetical protein
MINSRSDEFKVFSGPAFKAIENELYKHSYFVKHTPVPERPALVASLKQAGRVYYISDYAAFESHMTKEFLQLCECQLYRHCLADYPELAEIICRTLEGTNVIRTRSGYRARCIGRRMSGEMCTSLGNGFTNLMLTLFLCEEKGYEYDGFVEGDDAVFALHHPTLEPRLTAADYANLGFSIKLKQVPDPCYGSFCGLVCGESGQIIRDPLRFCQKFGWTTSFLHAGPAIMDQLLRAKALSAVYESPHCPIVSVLAREALRFTDGVNPRFVDDGFHTIPSDVSKLPEFAPTTETRLLFEHMFAISVDTQLLIEEKFRQGDFDVAHLMAPSPGFVGDLSGQYNEIASYADNYDFFEKYVSV